MGNHQAPPDHLVTQAGEAEFLTVNMLMPAAGDSAQEGASFAQLFVDLAARALERFGARRGNHWHEALGESAIGCPAGLPADPFDGQLLRFCEVDGGYQLHSDSHHATATQVGERDLGFEVVNSTLQ
jgi:hypothetical protein